MKAALKNDWYYLRFLLPILLIFSVLSTVTYNLPAVCFLHTCRTVFA